MDTPDQIAIYTTADGATQVRLQLKEGTAWLNQKQIAELFDVGVPTVSKHLKTLFEEGELSREATISKMENVALEQGRSVRRRIEHYSLDAILAVGYRVRGPRGTQFRKWATEVLREYLEKGFVLDDQRLKNDGADSHFDELLERVREIARRSANSSERSVTLSQRPAQITKRPSRTKQYGDSSRVFKTDSTLQPMGKPLQNSFIHVRTVTSPMLDSQFGRAKNRTRVT